MNFFSSFYNSLFNVAWLKKNSTLSGKAWGYFLIFTAIIAVITLVPVVVQVPSGIKQLREVVNEKIPDNFKADFKKGELSVSGLSQPYIFREEGQFVLVVNTNATSSLSLKDYLTNPQESGVLIDRQKIEFFDARKMQEQTQYLRDLPDFSLDKKQIQSWVQKIGPLMLIVVFFVVVTMLYIGTILGKLWSILLVTLIVFVLGLVTRRNWKFGQLFTIGLYAITLPSIISLVFLLLNIRLPYIHFLALLAFMVAVLFTRAGDSSAVNNVSSVDNQDNNLGA